MTRKLDVPEKESKDSMEKNKNNPVEGRLGIPSLTETEPHTKFTRRKTNYGFERLGITSDTESESDKPVSDISEKQKPPPLPIAAPPITVSPILKEITEQAGVAEAVEAVEPEHRYAVSNKLSKCKVILARKKTKKILLLAGIPVITLTLILWPSSDDGKTTPQSASATDQSHSNHAAGNAAKPVVVRIPQHAEPEQAIPAAMPAKSTSREIFEFPAEMKPEPETAAPVPAPAAPPQKPDKPKDTAPKPPAKTASVITVAPSRLGLRLGGIMRGSNGNIALINNRSVRVGQTVNNAKIVHIGDFSVEVELDGKRYLVAISSAPHEPSDEDEDESSDSDDDEAESTTEDEEE